MKERNKRFSFLSGLFSCLPLLSVFDVLIYPNSHRKDALIGNGQLNQGLVGNTQSRFPNTFLSCYFSNLQTNFLYNFENYCVLTSLGMMLSYYDTYWNDNLLDEDMILADFLDGDVFESPGIYADDEETCGPYVQLMISMFGYPSTLFPGVTNSTLPLTCNQVIDSLYNCESEDDRPIRLLDMCSSDSPSIIELIDSGNPVMVITAPNPIGHAMTAFAHSPDNQTIYLHNGYNDNRGYPMIVSMSISECYATFYLETLTEHVCSDNYGTGYCPCLDGGVHSHHQTVSIDDQTHGIFSHGNLVARSNHSFEYSSIDDSEHIEYCECGYSDTTSHFECNPSVLGVGYQHYLECRFCRHRWIDDHFPCYYSYSEENQFFDIWCYCGYPVASSPTEPDDLILIDPDLLFDLNGGML